MKTNSSKGIKPDSILKVNEDSELMAFLTAQLSHKSRNNIKSLLANNQVEVNGKVVRLYNHVLKTGSEVKVKWEREPVAVTKSFRGFSIVFEDEHLIVIDKHAGVLSIATEGEKNATAYNFLSKHVKRDDPAAKIFIVHRLDRETSGLMVFAKSQKVQQLFQDEWKKVVTERKYLAIIEGQLETEDGEYSSYLHENSAFVVYSDQNPHGGKKAVTHYHTVKKNDTYSMLEVWLDTGRKNQIRVHMQELGHPIIHDKKYGSTVNPIGRLGLHSKVLAFTHPVTGRNYRFDTPVPRKFTSLF
jgi:23S rRNA pseudouridine1911/1915/1917 synthase